MAFFSHEKPNEAAPYLRGDDLQAHNESCSWHPYSYKTWISRDDNNPLDLRVVVAKPSLKHSLWWFRKEQRKKKNTRYSIANQLAAYIGSSFLLNLQLTEEAHSPVYLSIATCRRGDAQQKLSDRQTRGLWNEEKVSFLTKPQPRFKSKHAVDITVPLSCKCGV